MYGLLQHKALFLFAILLLVLTSSPAVGYYLVTEGETIVLQNLSGQKL
jgi:hypothetical protein